MNTRETFQSILHRPKTPLFCPLFIYGLRYVAASGVGGMQLTSQTYFCVLSYTLKMIKIVQSRYRQSVIARGALYKKAMIWNRVKLWTRQYCLIVNTLFLLSRVRTGEVGKALKVERRLLMTALVNRGLRAACRGHCKDSSYPCVMNNGRQCIIVSKFLEPSQTPATMQNAFPRAPQGHEGGNQGLGRVNRQYCTKFLSL